MKKVAVVILNWNTEDYLRRFLPGVIASTYGVEGAEVIVADNASNDGSVEMMRERFAGVPLICFDRNYGFTGGYNRALKDLDYEYAVLLNSDVEVKPGWLEPLLRWMDEHPDCGACGPKLHALQDPTRFEYAGAAGGLIDRYGYPFCRGRVLKRVETDLGQYDAEPADVLWVTGACLLVRLSVWQKLGGLDERFFAHMEEIDLCWRMQLSGWKVTVVPESSVCHLGGGTLPANSPFKLRLNFRNNLLLLENNLARTLCLRMPAGKAFKKARKRIFWRKVCDGASAFTYLVCFRFRYFRAVLTAHAEFRKLRHKQTVQDLTAWRSSAPDRLKIQGYCETLWLIPTAFFKGKRIFSSLKNSV